MCQTNIYLGRQIFAKYEGTYEYETRPNSNDDECGQELNSVESPEIRAVLEQHKSNIWLSAWGITVLWPNIPWHPHVWTLANKYSVQLSLPDLPTNDYPSKASQPKDPNVRATIVLGRISENNTFEANEKHCDLSKGSRERRQMCLRR